jgi:hypothetical protein
MGMRTDPETERKILAAARPRDGISDQLPRAPQTSPRTFDDEDQFRAAVEAQAREWGWIVYHTKDSRQSETGFPDDIMIRRDRLLAWELKRTRKEKPSAAQRKWLRAFQGIAGAEVRIYSPEDWDSILKELS